MRTPKALGKWILNLTIIVTVSTCNQPYSQNPSVTNTPIDTSLFATPIGQTPAISMSDVANFGTGTALAQHTSTSEMGVPTVVGITPQVSDLPIMGTATAQDAETIIYGMLESVDQSLHQSMQSNIAYTAPGNMRLSDTVTVVLLLNPSSTVEQLATEVYQDPASDASSQPQVVTATIEITDRMKAELFTDDKEAFTIQPIPNNPEQLISPTETTRWAWLLTAHKAGSQKLTLVVSRLVRYAGLEYWRPVETYRADIDVRVTFGQYFASFDWKWLAGILITALLIPAFWRLYDQRKKQSEQIQQANPQRKKPK